MNDDNPTQIQWAPPNQRPATTPLVLIHDGGGTTFGYFTLDSLDRDVYGIHNPHYYTGEPWEGGMDEMSRHYIALLKKAGISGTIILGGWSLGGFLSLNMARMLAADDSLNITVAGILIIDSPFHLPLSKLPVEIAKVDLPNLPELVRKSLANSGAMMATWELPEWDAAAYEGRECRINISRRDVFIPVGHVLHKPLRGEATVKSIARRTAPSKASQQGKAPAIPPPAVLLRCVEHCKSKDSAKPTKIDVFRDKTMLGWDENYPEFIKAVIDVDSNHFNIFDFSKTEAVTKNVNEGLDILEALNVRMV